MNRSLLGTGYQGKKDYSSPDHTIKRQQEITLINAINTNRLNGRRLSHKEVTEIDECLSKYYSDSVDCKEAIEAYGKYINKV
jgi:hypothetical protein